MKKLLFLYNAHSGKGMIKSKIADIVELMVEYGYEVTIYPTQAAQDATRIVEKYGSIYDRIVCSGGDGTLDEVVTGMMHLEKRCPIGYIPAGSTNDFANSLKLPKNMLQAAETALRGRTFACDVGQFNDGHFVYVAAFGMFTEVSYATNQEMKNLLGHAAYILEGVKSLREISAYPVRVVHDGEVLEEEMIFGMVTNALSVGGFKNIAGKHVELDDGLFEVTLIKSPKNPIELNEIITALITNVDNTDMVHTFKTGSVAFEFDREVSWTLDGEYGGVHEKATVCNCQKAIEFVI